MDKAFIFSLKIELKKIPVTLQNRRDKIIIISDFKTAVTIFHRGILKLADK